MRTPGPRLGSWSRRAVLGGAAGSLGLALLPFARRPQQVLVPASLEAGFGEQLVRALCAATKAPFELVRVASLREVPALLDGVGALVYTFAGPALEAAVARGLQGRRHVRLSFGARLEPEPTSAPAAHVHLALTEAFEQAGQWAAQTLGTRAEIISTGHESTSDLPFAFRHGFEARGGEIVQTVVTGAPGALEQRPPAADLTLVLASGAQSPALWQALARRGHSGTVLTHPFAHGAPAGARLISTWLGGSALEALAARSAQPARTEVFLTTVGSFEPLRLTPQRPTAAAAIGSWALKSGNASPYTGC